MSDILINKLNFGDSNVDNIQYAGNTVYCLKWGDDIVWQKEIPSSSVQVDSHATVNKQWIINTNTSRNFGDGWTTYMSNSNYNVNNGVARCQITFTGFTEFTVKYASWAESSFDYTCVSDVNKDWSTISISNLTTGIVANTYGKQSTWYSYTYSGLDSGQTYSIWICYRKDGSAHSSDDRGYFAIQN